MIPPIANTIYISGPITDPATGAPRKGWKKDFRNAENYLHELCLEAINPVRLAQELETSMREHCGRFPLRWEYLMYDLQAMERARVHHVLAGIYMLNGWEDSYGARCELSLARSMGLPIFLQSHDGRQPSPTPPPHANEDDPQALAAENYSLIELGMVVEGNPFLMENNPLLKAVKLRLQIEQARRILESNNFTTNP